MHLNKQSRLVGVSIALALFIVSCGSPQINNTLSDSSISSAKISNISLSGQVQFPEDFSIKANQSDIITETSVSLIYPPNNTTKPNKVIATGLTNSTGGFIINPGSGFTPYTGEIFILEANKRLGGAGNNSLSLRTNVKWNGTSFESITTPGIYINTKTTALAIMSSFSTILADDTIGKMNVVSGVTQVSDINTTITEVVINRVKEMVESALTKNQDPVASINFTNGRFSLNDTLSGSKVLGCIGNPADCQDETLPEPIPTVTPAPTSTPSAGSVNPSSFGACIGDDANCSTPTPVPTPTSTPTSTPTASPTVTPTPTPVPTAVSGEFKVNTYTNSDQKNSSIAYSLNGDFVITWQSNIQDGNSNGIFAQRYNYFGVPQGPEFRVNTQTSNEQTDPTVAFLSTGDFVITWSSYGQDNSSNSIYAKRFNYLGAAQGSEFRVNTYTTSEQILSTIAASNNGDFVISWRSHGQDGSDYGIYAQRFNSLGAPQIPSTCASPTCNPTTGEFRVNTYTTGFQIFQDISYNSNGNFVIAWQSAGQDGSDYGVFAQVYDSNGNPVGSEFRVNTRTGNVQSNPAIASGTNGEFVVTWASRNQDNTVNEFGIYAQRYTDNGTPIGSEFRVNTYTIGDQYEADIAYGQNNNFIITWRSSAQDGDGYGVYAQKYTSSGDTIGSEFKVNTYTTGNQSNPSVAYSQNGNYIFTWQSNLQDGSGYGIYANK